MYVSLFMRQHFTLVTDQRSVAFMFDCRRRIMEARVSKLFFFYTVILYYSYSLSTGKRKRSVVSLSGGKLDELHRELCCQGWPASLFVKWREEYLFCRSCAEVTPKFSPINGTLLKATQPMERLNIDFKGPFSTSSNNVSLRLCIVDEFSRYPFCIPCKDTSATTNCFPLQSNCV